jgi:AcrR family transcriptional regulator
MRAIKQERAVRTRVEILEAAIKLFAQRGFLATTMAELARAIRMTPGALYWHFPTKEDVLIAAVEELRDRYTREFSDLIGEGTKRTAREQLMEYMARVHAFLGYHREYGTFSGMVSAESAEQNERVSQAVRQALTVCVEMVAAIIRHGQTGTGEFRDDLDANTLAHAVIAAHQGMVMHQRLHGDEISWDALVRSLDTVVLDGVLARR